MKKGLKSLILIIVLLTMFMMVGCLEVLDGNEKDLTSLPLEKIGIEGDIREKGIAYEITDNTDIGEYILAINKTYLKDIPSETGHYSISVSGEEYLLTDNTFNRNIIGVSIDETKTIEAIKKGTIKGIDEQKSKELTTKPTSARNDITIGYITIAKDPGENGTNLYRISYTIYKQMIMAHIFLYDTQDQFIPPVYITSSEDNTYTLSIYRQAKMATPDPSVNGTFTFLKGLSNHENYLEDIRPNKVAVEGGQIVIHPWENQFKDLGPEGNLTQTGNVINIEDDGISVLIVEYG